MYPGQACTAIVESITPGSDQGQVAASGLLPSAVPEVHGPLFVCLKLDDEEFVNSLPGAVSGEVAIYSPKGKPAQVICKVMIRMAAIKNYNGSN